MLTIAIQVDRVSRACSFTQCEEYDLTWVILSAQEGFGMSFGAIRVCAGAGGREQCACSFETLCAGQWTMKWMEPEGTYIEDFADHTAERALHQLQLSLGLHPVGK